MKLKKRFAAMGAAMVVASALALNASATELYNIDASGKHKIVAINEENGNYRHAVTKTYNYTGGTRRVGARVRQRVTANGSDLTDSYSTSVISNNLYYQKGNNCSYSNNPHYSIHFSEWYNSSAYESGLEYTKELRINIIY